MFRLSTPLILLALAITAALAGASMDHKAHQLIYSHGAKPAVSAA